MLGQGYTAAPSPSSPCTPAAKAPGAGGEVAGLLGDSETPQPFPGIAREFGKAAPGVEPSGFHRSRNET